MSTPPRDAARHVTDHAARHDTARRPSRAQAAAAGGVALAVALGFAARGLLPAAAHPGVAAGPAVPVSTAVVVRTDVSARQVVPGTFGYQGAFSVADEETGAGIVTWLPSVGDVVRRGRALLALAGQPVTLLYGQVPAWRDLAAGMTPGPDVRELQRNLAALGFGPGPADGQFGASTQAAVERWQRARGLAVTGAVSLGEIVFLPGPLRVTRVSVPLGAQVTAGTPVLSGTSLAPGISLWLTVGGPAVRAGDPVLVTLPNGSTVRGTVTSVGRVATVADGAGSNAGAGGGAVPAATIPVTVTIAPSPALAGLDQAPVQVAITQQRDAGVLAVPVTALLAQPGGGYAIRVSGADPRLIPVTTGLFDDSTSLVEVTGPGLSAGLTVQVAQG